MAVWRSMRLNCGIPQNMNIVTKVNSPVKAYYTGVQSNGVGCALSLSIIILLSLLIIIDWLRNILPSAINCSVRSSAQYVFCTSTTEKLKTIKMFVN